jgi:hypothetical protein
MVPRKNKCQRWILILVVALAGVNIANAAAIDDIQVAVSSQGCDRFAPSANSFVVYAKNNNTARPIDATFLYDSKPSSQSFSLWDASISPFTDHFPKNLEVRIAAGATIPIGCTMNYRPAPTPSSVVLVPITITVSGAAYVNPGAPSPAPEDARAFTAFVLQTGFPGCGPGGRTAGLFYALNLHPYARLDVAISLTGSGPMGQDLPPLGATRVGCSNGLNSPVAVATASLVYPPGQDMSVQLNKKNKKKQSKSPTFTNPFQQ